MIEKATRVFLGISCLAALGARFPTPKAVAAAPAPALFAQAGAKALASGVAPGIALAVVSNGRITYEGGFGLSDAAKREPVSANTRFAIGSLTKQFTAAAIMLLAQDGALSLGDLLKRYVPQLPNANHITLRMLLDQNSGLHNYPLLSEHDWPTHGYIGLSQLLAILATDKPDFTPGSRWEYSNANYAALAAVVEKTSGMSFGTFLHKRIFEPLHMRDSGFGYSVQQGIAVSYIGGKPEPAGLSLDLFSGAGGMVSSAHDLALWDLALMKGELPSRAYLNDVWDSGVPTGSQRSRYAMGWMNVQLAGHRELWHNGLAPQIGGYCYNAIFPDDRLAIIVLTNGYDAGGVPERTVQRIAAAYGIGAAPEAPVEPTPAAADDPAIDSMARAFWDQLASGNLDRSRLTPQFAAVLTPDFLVQVQQGIILLGPLKTFTFTGKETQGDATLYRYELVFASGADHQWSVKITADRKIAGSGFTR